MQGEEMTPYSQSRRMCADKGALERTRAAEKVRLELGFHDLVAHRVTHEFAHAVQVKFPHDVRAMGFCSLHADCKRLGHFLAALPFRQQLNDFAFARGKPVTGQLARLLT